MFGKKKKAAQEKEQALARLEKIRERLEGILYAQDNPEKVFDVISHSETPKDILNNLKKQCRLTEFQAECIRDMRLRLFSKQEKKALAEEYTQVRKAYEQERGGSW